MSSASTSAAKAAKQLAGLGITPETAPPEVAESIARTFDLASAPFPDTELGDAEFFAGRHGNELRFDKRRGAWLRLNDRGLWALDPLDAVVGLAGASTRERQRVATLIQDPDKRKAAWTWAFRGESRARLTNALALAANLQPIADDGHGWDPDPWLLGCPNGVVDLRDGTLRDGRPEDRVSLSTGIAYDPAATSELWERALAEIFPHAGLVDYVQRALGYTVTGHTNFDKWFLGHGEGRNGKGVVYGAVRAALGDYALELPASVFDARGGNEWDLAKLPGRRFVTSAESGDAIRLNHDLLKKLTGGDRQRAADKYEKSFEFDPVCKLWLACNRKPQVADDSAGFWARVIVIPFTESFLGREDVSLRPALQDRDGPHAPAVLAWLVRGAVLAASQGLGDPPVVVREAGALYREESGPLADFVAACVVRPDATATGEELRRRYIEWCDENHVRFPLGPRAFGLALKARFASKHERTGTRYTGIGVAGPVTGEREDLPF